MKNKKEITGIDVKIIFSIIGIIASIIVIIINFIDGESKAIGIALLSSCFTALAVNVKSERQKIEMENKDK